MLKRKIFKKKKSNKKIFFSYLIISLIIIIFFFYFYNISINKNIILIPENKNVFYIIPEDRGGEKVPNLDKKSLNLKSQNKSQIVMSTSEDLFFSIQFYSNNELKETHKYLEKIINLNKEIYKLEDFYILALNSLIDVEYLLLYKNFEKRDTAYNYCLDFLINIENCLIVDTTKF